MKQEILDAIKEVHQPRSEFQLKYFVVGQHDTDEMSYVQTLLEIEDLYTAFKKMHIKKRRLEIEIERLIKTGDELDFLDSEEKQLDLDKIIITLNGIIRELEVLEKIWDSFPKKYTRKEIEDDQPSYWKLRLVRQAALEAMSTNGSISWSNLDALRQINELTNIAKEVNDFELKMMGGGNKEIQ